MAEISTMIKNLVDKLSKNVDEGRKNLEFQRFINETQWRQEKKVSEELKTDTKNVFKKMIYSMENSVMSGESTWKGLIRSISMSYGKLFKQWWDNLKEQHKTIRLLANVGTKIKESWSSLINTVAGHITDVLGPELTALITGVYEGVKNTIKNVWSFFKGDKESRSEKKRNRLLQWLVNHFKGEKLSKMREFKEKKPVKMFLAILTLLLGAVVGFLGQWKKVVMTIFAPLKSLKITFSKTGKIGKIFRWIGGVFRYLEESSSIIGKAFRIGKVLGKVFFWVFAIIDFFIGFYKTEGNIFDKIKGGLKNVVRGLIKFPLQIIGWIGDQILKSFGIKTNLYEDVGKAVEKVLDIMFMSPIEIFKKMFSFIRSKLSNQGVRKMKSMFSKLGQLFDRFWEAIKSGFGWIFDIFKSIVNWFTQKETETKEKKQTAERSKGWISSLFSKEKTEAERELEEKKKKTKEELKPVEETPLAKFDEVHVKLLQVAKLQGAEKLKEREDAERRHKETSKRMENIERGTIEQSTVMNQMNQNTKNEPQREIPDTVENAALGLMNLSK